MSDRDGGRDTESRAAMAIVMMKIINSSSEWRLVHSSWNHNPRSDATRTHDVATATILDLQRQSARKGVKSVTY